MIKLFRKIAVLEGISFLLILFVTMPLKFIWNIPEPTFYVGMAHGVLFVVYVIFALWIAYKKHWNIITLFWILFASIVPFGTFVADYKILRNLDKLPS